MELLKRRYELMLPISVNVNKNVLEIFGAPLEHDVKRGFNEISSLHELQPKKVCLPDLLSIYSANIELIFVDRDDIPPLYEELLIMSERLVKAGNRDPELMAIIHELANELKTKYGLRLKRAFFEHAVDPYDKIRVNGVRIETYEIPQLKGK